MPIQKITSGIIQDGAVAAADIVSVANTAISGNIISSQIAPSVTLTTPIISGNLNLDSVGTTGIRVPSANAISFHTAGTEYMRITSAGDVGIGTSSPTTYKSAKLAIRNSSSSGEAVLAIINNSSNVYEGAGILLGSTAANTNYGATWLYHTYNTNSPTNTTSYAFNISQRATDGTYVSNIWNVDYQNSVSSWYRPNTSALQMQLDASNNLLFNSGYGSAAIAYGCRVWVNFNGTGTVAIRASGNVSSITDNGTGDYQVNFTTAMPDANYSAVGTNSGSGTTGEYSSGIISMTSSAVRMIAFKSQVGTADPTYFCVSVFR
jgi:hypothetical protein